MSPTTRKAIEAVAVAWLKSVMANVQPREKKQPPLSCPCSCSRRMLRSGQLSRTKGM